MAERTSRETNTRDTAQRTKAWEPHQTLPTPNPQPGWVFRWIRTGIMGQVDPTNMSAKLRQGWEPVKAADHPELYHTNEANSRFKDGVEIGGLVLCKAPAEMVASRKEWFENQTKAQTDAVDNNFMKTNDARMPLFNEKRSGVSFGRGSK